MTFAICALVAALLVLGTLLVPRLWRTGPRVANDPETVREGRRLRLVSDTIHPPEKKS